MAANKGTFFSISYWALRSKSFFANQKSFKLNLMLTSMELEDYFKNAKAYVWKETFAICKSKHPIARAFVNIIDKDETTVIIDQKEIHKHKFESQEKDYKVLTLDVVFPQNVAGVTAKIASCLAKKGISIMPIAAYSRDHFLIKKDKTDLAIASLKELGIKF